MAVTMNDVVCDKNQQSPQEGSHFTLYQEFPTLTMQVSLHSLTLGWVWSPKIYNLDQVRSSHFEDWHNWWEDSVHQIWHWHGPVVCQHHRPHPQWCTRHPRPHQGGPLWRLQIQAGPLQPHECKEYKYLQNFTAQYCVLYRLTMFLHVKWGIWVFW